MRYWIFYYLTVSSKKSCIFWKKRQKTVSGAQVSFEGKGVFGDENKYKLFYGKWGFEYLFFHLTIFLKKATFLEKMGKKIFGRPDHFLGEVVILR